MMALILTKAPMAVRYAKVAINTLIYNGDMQIVYSNVGKLWIVIAVVTFVSVIFARRNKV